MNPEMAQLMKHPLRPRMAAIARDAGEAVRFAGGWLFDQAMLGWEVHVLTADSSAARALSILGVQAHDLDDALASEVPFGACLRVVAIPADLYRCDERVRLMARGVLGTGASGPGELRLWGGDEPADPRLTWGPQCSTTRVSHTLSLATRAFKAQALVAASVPAPGGVVGGTEVFRRVTITATAPVQALGGAASGAPRAVLVRTTDNPGADLFVRLPR